MQARLTALPDQMEFNIACNLLDCARSFKTTIAQQVMEDIHIGLAHLGEVDQVEQCHYMAGPNYDEAMVMYCITGDTDWLPDARDDHHYDW